MVVEQAWSESGASLGSHPLGAPVRTIDQVHDECQAFLDGLDPLRYTLLLETDVDGRMIMCGGFAPLLADSPGETVSITDFTVTS